MPMQPETIRCLERVEAALDPAHLARTHQLWEDCRHYRPVSHLPTVVCCPAPDWPQYSMAEIQSDREKMLVSELAPVYTSARIGDDRLPEIRANYGTGILPSLFGCEIVHLEPTTLPAALPLHDTDRIRAWVDAGIPDLRAGLGGASWIRSLSMSRRSSLTRSCASGSASTWPTPRGRSMPPKSSGAAKS